MVADLDELFRVERLGVIMEPQPDEPNEEWGVLNPACARTRRGDLVLFPRVVAANNYSRVGIARVRFDVCGSPVGVERLGYALEPHEPCECNHVTAGCEDPRVTYVPALNAHVMTYTALGPSGPRIALAVSDDLFIWRKLGVVNFAAERGVEFNVYDNKDGLIFPDLVTAPDGRTSIALLHRPTYDLPGDPPYCLIPDGVTESRPSIWISYCPIDRIESDCTGIVNFAHHRLVAGSEQPWEALKIGGGTPPVLTEHGWITLFHGVSIVKSGAEQSVRYCAGVLVLDPSDPARVLYRSATPVLAPATSLELCGVVDNVVFPTAVDVRAGGRLDVYYGMADCRIGVGSLQVPASSALAASTIAAA